MNIYYSDLQLEVITFIGNIYIRYEFNNSQAPTAFLPNWAQMVYSRFMNQLQALEALEKSKFTKAQAKALVSVLGDLEDRAITRNDLRVLKAEMIMHVYTAAGVVIAFLSFIKFFS